MKEKIHRPMDQKREPRNKSTQYSQLIFDKGPRAVQLRNDGLYNPIDF